MRHVARLDDFASRELLGLVNQDPSSTRTLDPSRALLAHRLERADASLVTVLSRLDTLPDPGFLLGELLVEERVLPVLLGLGARLLREILSIAAGPAAQLAAVEIDDARRYALHERPIVRDEQHGARIAPDLLLEPFDGADVEVVSRLVEQQQIRSADERAAERCTAPPASRELVEA